MDTFLSQTIRDALCIRRDMAVDSVTLGSVMAGDRPGGGHLQQGTECHDEAHLMNRSKACEFTERLTCLHMELALAPNGQKEEVITCLEESKHEEWKIMLDNERW